MRFSGAGKETVTIDLEVCHICGNSQKQCASGYCNYLVFLVVAQLGRIGVRMMASPHFFDMDAVGINAVFVGNNYDLLLPSKMIFEFIGIVVPLAFSDVLLFFLYHLLCALSSTGIAKITYPAVMLSAQVNNVIVGSVSDTICLNPDNGGFPYNIRASYTLSIEAYIRKFRFDFTKPAVMPTKGHYTPRSMLRKCHFDRRLRGVRLHLEIKDNVA